MVGKAHMTVKVAARYAMSDDERRENNKDREEKLKKQSGIGPKGRKKAIKKETTKSCAGKKKK